LIAALIRFDAGAMRAPLLLAIFAASCASTQPAPIDYGRAENARPSPQTRSTGTDLRRASRAVEPAPIERPAPRPHREAETPNWAAGPGTPLSAYALQPSEAQPYDPANPTRTHRVALGETLYAIASAHQTPLRALIDQNGLEPPYALTEGQELRLPPARLHRVAAGEDFESVARRYNVDLRSLALLNRMRAPYEVRTGDQIVLPAIARESAPEAAPQTRPAPMPDTPMRAARFTWPVRGDVVTRFGAQPGGRRSDGVEINAREGDAIGAAADGEVVYAGSDLPAYGTLILVRHGDGFVTAYGYARNTRVRAGQRVRQGETLGEVGARGGRLLFQVRQGATAADPLPLLGAG